jgi:hypothetical protein
MLYCLFSVFFILVGVKNFHKLYTHLRVQFDCSLHFQPRLKSFSFSIFFRRPYRIQRKYHGTRALNFSYLSFSGFFIKGFTLIVGLKLSL